MKRCCIFGAGELFSKPKILKDDFVIAADGGFAYLLKFGIKPDVLLGDFDSLSESLVRQAGETYKFATAHSSETMTDIRGETDELSVLLRDVEILKYPVMKDETDMLIAYRLGASRGCDEFHVFGGVGGREDHTYANYCLLLEAKQDGKQAFLYNNNGRVFAIKNEKIKLFGERGKTVSVFAFGGVAEGVSIRGLKYEAEKVMLSPSSSLGVSNSYTDSGDCEISVENGALLIFEEF